VSELYEPVALLPTNKPPAPIEWWDF